MKITSTENAIYLFISKYTSEFEMKVKAYIKRVFSSLELDDKHKLYLHYVSHQLTHSEYVDFKQSKIKSNNFEIELNFEKIESYLDSDVIKIKNLLNYLNQIDNNYKAETIRIGKTQVSLHEVLTKTIEIRNIIAHGNFESEKFSKGINKTLIGIKKDVILDSKLADIDKDIFVSSSIYQNIAEKLYIFEKIKIDFK